jgi:glutamate racemase
MTSCATAIRPIGVFDSGIGGLSVLGALRKELPQEQFVYVADAGHAPYGERDSAHVLKRSLVLADYLYRTHQVKALVLACNTATAAAVASLRQQYANLPIVGIEPALKPAAAQSGSGVVAVMATRSTLESEKFQALLAAQTPSVRYLLQACDGLAAAIEQSDRLEIEALCQRYVQSLRQAKDGGARIDTVVLGCTHYALVVDVLSKVWGPGVALLEAGEPVARRTRQVLEAAGSFQKPQAHVAPHGSAIDSLFYTTGDPVALDQALKDWLLKPMSDHATKLQLP